MSKKGIPPFYFFFKQRIHLINNQKFLLILTNVFNKHQIQMGQKFNYNTIEKKVSKLNILRNPLVAIKENLGAIQGQIEIKGGKK